MVFSAAYKAIALDSWIKKALLKLGFVVKLNIAAVRKTKLPRTTKEDFLVEERPRWIRRAMAIRMHELILGSEVHRPIMNRKTEKIDM